MFPQKGWVFKENDQIQGKIYKTTKNSSRNAIWPNQYFRSSIKAFFPQRTRKRLFSKVYSMNTNTNPHIFVIKFPDTWQLGGVLMRAGDQSRQLDSVACLPSFNFCQWFQQKHELSEHVIVGVGYSTYIEFKTLSSFNSRVWLLNTDHSIIIIHGRYHQG